jgi:hypothetical protein
MPIHNQAKMWNQLQTPTMSQFNPNVVSVGQNRELLLLRDAVLRSAGFDVFTTDNENEALARISQADCGVLQSATPLPYP